METVAKNLAALAESLKKTIAVLMQHSSLYRRNEPGSTISLIASGDYGWSDLGVEGLQAQGKAIKEYRHLKTISFAILTGQPQSILDTFKNKDAAISELLEQQSSLSTSIKEEATILLNDAIDTIISLVKNLGDASNQVPIYIPDTNALLTNPDMEKWRFRSVTKFDIGLIPAVLAELDALKINRADAVKNKAKGIITRIKGYRTRGKLTEGVHLTQGISTLRTFAVEPSFENTLPWLDKTNNDDRILGTTLEVMRLFPHSPVILVTRDINLQNKAEFACFSFTEPPAVP